jgi:hypothetical protein
MKNILKDVRHGLRTLLVLVGVVIGISGALALTRFLTAMLFGVTPTDTPTFVDPLVALRYE